MRFEQTAIPGAVVVELEPHEDDRGFFARAFCAREFAEAGIEAHVEQANLSYNRRAGTIRGLHYQAAEAPEAKLFRCIAGETYHVVVDTRPGSETYGRWVGVHLSAASRRALAVPAVCATGYQALTDGAEVLYLVSAAYTPGAERGIGFDDPALGIEWPLPATEVSEKDRAWPPFGGTGAG